MQKEERFLKGLMTQQRQLVVWMEMMLFGATTGLIIGITLYSLIMFAGDKVCR